MEIRKASELSKVMVDLADAVGVQVYEEVCVISWKFVALREDLISRAQFAWGK